MAVRKLDKHVSWTSHEMQNEADWTVSLSKEDHRELHEALQTAKTRSEDVLEITQDDFPLNSFKTKLQEVSHELLNGRGFVRLSSLDGDRYSDEDLTLIYWGIGLHLGDPWPQNKHGHVLGDVIDQNRAVDDPHARGNEIGGSALQFHTDGSDFVGLMCLHEGQSGGLSLVSNAVRLHNEMVGTRPDLAEALYEPMPWDFRGEEAPGERPYYFKAPFTEHDGKFFLFCVPPYIRASQRHETAPRLSDIQLEALTMLEELAAREDMYVAMPLRRGDIQFVYNYHVFHGRTAYIDPPPPGHKRHLKRLWLSAHELKSRPEQLELQVADHWEQNRSASRMELGIS